jgi:glutamate-1-semialdehyde 2,1-aminomutase
MMPWIAVSQSHGDSELEQTLDALDAALSVYARALNGKIEDFLQGPAIRPVFRTHN